MDLLESCGKAGIVTSLSSPIKEEYGDSKTTADHSADDVVLVVEEETTIGHKDVLLRSCTSPDLPAFKSAGEEAFDHHQRRHLTTTTIIIIMRRRMTCPKSHSG